jgi:hypothetical protein
LYVHNSLLFLCRSRSRPGTTQRHACVRAAIRKKHTPKWAPSLSRARHPTRLSATIRWTPAVYTHTRMSDEEHAPIAASLGVPAPLFDTPEGDDGGLPVRAPQDDEDAPVWAVTVRALPRAAPADADVRSPHTMRTMRTPRTRPRRRHRHRTRSCTSKPRTTPRATRSVYLPPPRHTHPDAPRAGRVPGPARPRRGARFARRQARRCPVPHR